MIKMEKRGGCLLNLYWEKQEGKYEYFIISNYFRKQYDHYVLNIYFALMITQSTSNERPKI